MVWTLEVLPGPKLLSANQRLLALLHTMPTQLKLTIATGAYRASNRPILSTFSATSHTHTRTQIHMHAADTKCLA